MIQTLNRILTPLGLKPAARKTLTASLHALSTFKRFHTVTRKGLRYRLDLSEVVDASIYLRGEWEPETCEFLRQEVKPTDTVIEVGANIGSHTVLLSKLCKHVYAFEATESAAEKLHHNLRLNAVGNVTVIRTLVSDHEQSGFGTPIVSSCPRWEKPVKMEYSATATSLDDFADSVNLEFLDLLKIDVDGFDYKVLRGAATLISKFCPVVLIELSEPCLNLQGDSVDKIVSFLTLQGYSHPLFHPESCNAVFRPSTSQSCIPASKT